MSTVTQNSNIFMYPLPYLLQYHREHNVNDFYQGLWVRASVYSHTFSCDGNRNEFASSLWYIVLWYIILWFYFPFKGRERNLNTVITQLIITQHTGLHFSLSNVIVFADIFFKTEKDKR